MQKFAPAEASKNASCTSAFLVEQIFISLLYLLYFSNSKPIRDMILGTNTTVTDLSTVYTLNTIHGRLLYTISCDRSDYQVLFYITGHSAFCFVLANILPDRKSIAELYIYS